MGQTENGISAEEISQAQQVWGDGIVAIGKEYTDKGDYTKIAENHIDTLYAFEDGIVLFKPTKAADKQFRLTKEAALSYFVTTTTRKMADLPCTHGQKSVLRMPVH